MKFLLLPISLILALSLTGCEKPQIQGHAFIIKGNGDIKPSAGRTVYLIPEKSEHSLISKALNAVSASTLNAIEPQLTKLCSSAHDFILKADSKIISEIQLIKDNGNIPLKGCGTLQEGADSLNSISANIEAKFLKETADIESKIKRESLIRSAKIASSAKKLERDALAKITARLSINPIIESKIALTNKTDYCIKGSVQGDVFSKGIKIGRVEMSYSPTMLKDKYGFPMDCAITPHSKEPLESARMTFWLDRIRHYPKLKLLVEKHGLPLKNGRLIPDKVVVTAAKFGLAPVRKKAGDSIKYTSKSVSFSKIASQKSYSEDSNIASLNKELAALKKNYKSNITHKQYTIAKNKLGSCISDQSQLEEKTHIVTSLSQISKTIANCQPDQIDNKKLYKSLADLNRAHGAVFALPDISNTISIAATEQVIRLINELPSRSTDTTINGLFKFKNVPKGNYLLFSEYKDSFVSGFWLNPITVQESGQFDLNNNTFTAMEYLTHLKIMILKKTTNVGPLH